MTAIGYNVLCKYCGQDELHWENNINSGFQWKLFDECKKLHVCRSQPITGTNKVTMLCSQCHGRKTMVSNLTWEDEPCDKCNGEGTITFRR